MPNLVHASLPASTGVWWHGKCYIVNWPLMAYPQTNLDVLHAKDAVWNLNSEAVYIVPVFIHVEWSKSAGT